ncbi:uncharacterized protein LOC111633362 isoform X1 [Centruroides sculpturatus]|uniref:uncharacterized protein LOC111633362 isoform X1 n=1 Tax=Centruroides sculpturatus TaxID=218467 RepID=UPI000C6E85FE|nr:uncharacterized protein LOC111633362 isoform X1 [Centruroides sculpturatus]
MNSGPADHCPSITTNFSVSNLFCHSHRLIYFVIFLYEQFLKFVVQSNALDHKRKPGANPDQDFWHDERYNRNNRPISSIKQYAEMLFGVNKKTRWYALNTSLSWRKLHHNLQTDLIIYLVTTLFRKFYHQESSTIQEIIRNYLDYMNLHHCKSWRKLLYTIIHRLTHYLLSNNVVQKILPPGIKHNPRINSELSGLHEPTPL